MKGIRAKLAMYLGLVMMFCIWIMPASAGRVGLYNDWKNNWGSADPNEEQFRLNRAIAARINEKGGFGASTTTVNQTGTFVTNNDNRGSSQQTAIGNVTTVGVTGNNNLVDLHEVQDNDGTQTSQGNTSGTGPVTGSVGATQAPAPHRSW